MKIKFESRIFEELDFNDWDFFLKKKDKYGIMLLINQKWYLNGWKWIVRFLRLKIRFENQVFEELDFNDWDF